MTSRRCPSCNCNNTIKFGNENGKQKYRCSSCKKVWRNSSRPTRTHCSVWKNFVKGKLSIATLAKKYGRDQRTIRRYLDLYLPPSIKHEPRRLVIVADVTYFGRSDGKLVVIDPNSTKYSLLYFCNLNRSEKTVDYASAISELINRGYRILGAVIDGRRGVRQMMERRGILVQHCQFHQLLTVTQCLTKKPKLPQNIELKRIAATLTSTTEAALGAKLHDWHQKYGDWLKESYVDLESGRKRYVHDKTRRAFFSLKRNLPYLFTFQNPVFDVWGVKLPNTTNALDGRFGAYKRVVKSNPRCSKRLKTKIFFYLLSSEIGVKNN